MYKSAHLFICAISTDMQWLIQLIIRKTYSWKIFSSFRFLYHFSEFDFASRIHFFLGFFVGAAVASTRIQSKRSNSRKIWFALKWGGARGFKGLLNVTLCGFLALKKTEFLFYFSNHVIHEKFLVFKFFWIVKTIKIL